MARAFYPLRILVREGADDAVFPLISGLTILGGLDFV